MAEGVSALYLTHDAPADENIYVVDRGLRSHRHALPLLTDHLIDRGHADPYVAESP
jgi:hypothetical protein